VTVAERMPFCAGALRPLKKANCVGSLTVVVVSESIGSMTMCEWPACEDGVSLEPSGEAEAQHTDDDAILVDVLRGCAARERHMVSF
jgi:hypothetical protein